MNPAEKEKTTQETSTKMESSSAAGNPDSSSIETRVSMLWTIHLHGCQSGDMVHIWWTTLSWCVPVLCVRVRSFTMSTQFGRLLTTYLSTLGWHWGSNFFTVLAKKPANRWHFQYTLPRLVDVFKERPLTQPTLNPHEFFISELLWCLRGNQGCMAF